MTIRIQDIRSFLSWNSHLLCLLMLLLGACVQTPPVNDAVTKVSGAPNRHTLLVAEREVEVWAWGEANSDGVVLFSHGAQSAPWKYEPMIQEWIGRGLRVYAPLHVDSTDHPQTADYPGLASWTTRLEDMELIAKRFGGDAYVAAGHSYGALLALVKGGVSATKAGFQGQMNDARVSLVLAFSPPPAIPGLVDLEAFADLRVPALIQTGTRDIPMGDTTRGWRVHLDAFEQAPSGGASYALVIDDVDHYFGGAICRPELPGPAQEAELAVALDFASLMIDAYHFDLADAKLRVKAAVNPSNTAEWLSKAEVFAK
ncbi:MAG: alpha/beta hydrolase [Woeseiaceae bacterium]